MDLKNYFNHGIMNEDTQFNNLSDETIWRLSTDLSLILSNHKDKTSEAFVFWYSIRTYIEEQIHKRFSDVDLPF